MGKEQHGAEGQLGLAENPPDPEELWLDQSIEPEELVRIDPLDITSDMVEVAEHPELADGLLRGLPERGFSLRGEALFRERIRRQLKAGQRSVARGGCAPAPRVAVGVEAGVAWLVFPFGERA